jgi:hypothetical protein
MKIFKVLLVVAIAFGMMACNNEQDVPQINGEKDASISIKVFPSSDSPSFRATGNLSGDGITEEGLDVESAIKKLEVWVFAGDVLDGYGSSVSATPDEVKNIVAHVGSRDIVVVANANIGNVITSKATLLATLKDLPTDVATNGLIMTSEPFTITLEKGKNFYGYTGTDVAGVEKYHEATPRAITRVNARVAIVDATLDYNNVPADQKLYFDNLKDLQVAMFNVPKQTYLFGPLSLATDDDFQFGALWDSPKFSYVGVGTGTPNNLLYNALTNVLPSEPIVKELAPYYYVNENKSTKVGDGTSANPAEKMIIVLRAKVYNGSTLVTELKDLYTDAEGYTYYPVWVNKDGLTESGNVGNSNVYRNTQYNISLTIKGLGRPTIDEVDKAFLDVKVTVTPWTVVGQTVTWE